MHHTTNNHRHIDIDSTYIYIYIYRGVRREGFDAQTTSATVGFRTFDIKEEACLNKYNKKKHMNIQNSER